MLRIVVISIFLFCCAFSLQAQEDNITINASNIRIGKLLKEISKQSDADFSYNSKVLDTRERISFQVENASLESTLQQLTQQIGVDYLLVEGQIILRESASGTAPPSVPVPEKVPEKRFTISGFLSDGKSGESLISAAVAVKGTSKGVLTNEFGFYSLSLKAGTYKMVFSYVGYEALEIEVDLKNDIKKVVALEPASFELPQIVVELPVEAIAAKKSLGEINLAPEDLNNLPEFGGESGLVKGLQTLPGVSTQSDGSAFFYTRGGERDQNLVIIDDAPIYNPSHLLGFYSMIVPDFTRQITVHKSDIPASMGDRLSSIISIRTGEGNLNKLEFSGALNPFINRFTIETPIRKEKSSLFASVRRSNYQWLYNQAQTDASFQFWDLHLKWNRKINDNNRLYFTLIQGADDFNAGPGAVNGVRWGNSAATLRWNHIYNPRLFSNTTIYTGNYSYKISSDPNFWVSELGTLSLKMDFTHYTRPNLTSKYGFELQGYFNTPGRITLDSSIAVLPSIDSDQSRKGVLYYQGEWQPSDRWNIRAGLRMISWQNLGPKRYFTYDENYAVADTVFGASGVYHQYLNADPRLSIQFQLDSTSHLKASYGVYHQYLNLILNSVSPFTSFEVWLPANPNILPQSAQQWALDYLKQFPKSGWEVAASAYYKLSRNQIDYEAHATTYLNPLLEAELRFGTNRSYGLEFMLRKDFGRVNGWLAYTYSRVTRQTKDLNNNEPYRAFQDRPHDFSMVLNFKLSKRVLASTYWTSYSGSTFTSPVGFYEFNDQTVPVYGQRNNDRLPAYHRMDIAFQFQLHKRPDARYRHHLTFSLYNALARKNVYAIKFNKLESEQPFPAVPANLISDDLLSASEIDLIRFFPSLTYKFSIR